MVDFADYGGSPYTVISRRGGAVQISVGTDSYSSTSLSIRGCFVQATKANASCVMMNINAAAGVTAGLQLPVACTSNGILPACPLAPIYMPVSQLTALQFYAGEAGDCVNIVYLEG